MKPPTQPLPWHVESSFEFLSWGVQIRVHRIVDADGALVASFGPVRAEADFVCAIANAWHATQKRRKR